jgi:hypothetical protein
MKKKKLRKIIKALKMENARLTELNKQGLSEELERGFNDLLNTGVSVSGKIEVKKGSPESMLKAMAGGKRPLVTEVKSENRFVTDIESEHPIDLYLNAERLTPESHAKLMQDQHERQKNLIAKSTEPKEQSSAEIWKEWVDKTNKNESKGIFDNPKYRSPFFTFGPFGNIEENNVEGNPI